MTSANDPMFGGVRRASWHRTACAIAVAGSLVNAAALAQNVPYQSGHRANFGRDVGQRDLPLGVTFEPRLDGAIQYADSDRSGSSLGIELAPGAYAAYNSRRFKGALDYSLIGRLWDDGDFDDITQSLAANGRWNAVPDLFSISGDASYGDVLIDSTQGGNQGNIGVFNPGNVAEQAAASVRPQLRKRFKDFEAVARYSYGRVWYFDQGKGQPTSPIARVSQEDAENQAVDFTLGLVPGESRFSGKAFYTWAHSDFEISVPYEFERAGVEGGVELSRSVALVGDVGKESALDESTSAGGLDSDFWSAGLRWERGQRTSLEARYGERFFGSSYEFEARHQARQLSFKASYGESPDVEARRIGLGEFEPGELPPWFDPNADLGIYSSQPYVGENLRVGVTAEGSRTTIGLRAYDTKRDYIDDLFGDEHSTGVSAIASRRLAVNASVDVQFSYVDRQRDETLFTVGNPLPASHTYETDFTMRGNRDFGPRLIVSAEAGYFSNSGTADNAGWWVGLRGRWFPEFRR
jgi:hypothetical protein